MDVTPRPSHFAPGAYAVVVPGRPGREVRVIDWPGDDSPGALRREIDTPATRQHTVGGLCFWSGRTLLPRLEREVNGRAAWLARSLVGHDQTGPAPAGTVVITLAGPPGDTTSTATVRGMSRELADWTAEMARTTPGHDLDALAQLLAAEVPGPPRGATSAGAPLRVGVVYDLNTATDWGAVAATLSWMITTAVRGRAEHVARIPAAPAPGLVGLGRRALDAAVTEAAHLAGLDEPPEPAEPEPEPEPESAVRSGPVVARRLLVLITRARTDRATLQATWRELARLQDGGCAVLWLCPSTDPCHTTTIPGASVQLVDPQRPYPAARIGAAMIGALDRDTGTPVAASVSTARTVLTAVLAPRVLRVGVVYETTASTTGSALYDALPGHTIASVITDAAYASAPPRHRHLVRTAAAPFATSELSGDGALPRLPTAVDTAVGLAGLDESPAGARLLVLVTAGCDFASLAAARERLDRLRDRGCATLLLCPARVIWSPVWFPGTPTQLVDADYPYPDAVTGAAMLEALDHAASTPGTPRR